MARVKTGQPTRADLTYAQIRQDILNGHLEPGSKLGFAGLAARYGASSGVLREVLPRLVEQGLATAEPQLGYRVVPVSEPDLLALTSAREPLESFVVSQSVSLGDLSWESSVVAAHHELARTPALSDAGEIPPEWLDAHERFHLVLLEGCGNRYLVDVATRLRSIAEVYRCWTRDRNEVEHRDVAREHREIAEAAVARDSARAGELIRQHIRLTAEVLLGRSLDDDPAAMRST